MVVAAKIASIPEAPTIVHVVTSTIWKLMDGLALNCHRDALVFKRQKTVKWTASKTWITRCTSYANKTTKLCWPKTDAEI